MGLGRMERSKGGAEERMMVAEGWGEGIRGRGREKKVWVGKGERMERKR